MSAIFFETENKAKIFCTMKNASYRRAGNYRDTVAIVDGPECNYAVVDLETAIDLGMGYEIC